MEGFREVLDYRLYPKEVASNYTNILLDLKGYGCDGILLISTDGLTGVRDAYLDVFPEAKHQSC